MTVPLQSAVVTLCAGDRPEGWKQCLKDLAELRREETWERAVCCFRL